MWQLPNPFVFVIFFYAHSTRVLIGKSVQRILVLNLLNKMELFTINRYTTEKPQEASKNEEAILQQILQKVEKRKRKKSTVELIDIEAGHEKKKPLNDVISKDPAISELKDINTAEVIDTDKDVDPVADDEPEESHFQVLGEDVDKSKPQKVNMVLPSWLAHPTVISTTVAPKSDAASDDAAINKLTYLAPHIRHTLKEMQFSRLFPVQTAVIPWLLEAQAKPPPFRPRDICVSAPTGSGKTLAFAIPVVQLLANRVERKIRALVVLPVAELALQVFKVFKKLCEKTDLSVCLLSKKFPFAQEQEKLVELYKGQYYSKVDIVVTTPGRLVDHLHATKGFCLKALRFLVIDEADRIMDAVFQNWLYHLDEHVRATSDQLLSGRAAPLCFRELESSYDTQPHKLLFSATLSQDPEKLQNLRLFQPKLFTSVLANLSQVQEKFADATSSEVQKSEELRRGEFIGKYTTPAELSECYCIIENRIKPLTLFALINENEWTKFLCFTNSAESSNRLSFVLNSLFKEDLVIRELSASITPKERANVLSQFARGRINGLVCSDALARGIDIPDVDVVISYDLPRHIKTYIHRIGRTARAGSPGTAITMLTQKELQQFNHILGEVGKILTNEMTVKTNYEAEYAKQYTMALQELRRKVEQDKRLQILRKERVKDNAKLAAKDPSKMSVMEKLQLQVSTQVGDIEQDKEESRMQKNNMKNNMVKRKKFNASAGKTKEIQK
ncbi:probable ATP-dependent RNA helicase Dbp73D [Zeugodacus cucurbitae]|uniref:probable ATP-dependent RNA helicase Dbp73D n=1 Tax=Zeugodacus cucurbitae TaxID=28588 RepID=UPI0023D922FA|nr:probable ATP-dependent RNA helicase Dbp73D [Zeugodacus cucurbitae]